MVRKIIDPRFINEDMTQVSCKFDYGDRVVDVTVNKPKEGEEPNPDWVEIMEDFGEETLAEEFQIGLKRHREAQKERVDREKEMKERAISEELFNHKIKLFEIPEIQSSKNRKMKSKIRKAETMEAAGIYAAALVSMEVQADEKLGG